MTYLIDSNVLIQAKNEYYGFEIVPGFWTWLEATHAQGQIHTVPSVMHELTQIQDELSAWVKTMPATFVRHPDADTLASMGVVSAWVQTSKYTDLARQTFLGAADFHLVAHAHAHGLTIVTQEVSAPQATASIKIPDACAALGVECLQTFRWLRSIGARF